MNWKFSGERPVYQQIMETLRGAIVKGELTPGKKVPSVRELAAQAQVNPNTMQRALTELEREGLLVGGGTSGRTVTTDQGVLSAMKEQILEELARECAEKFLVFGVTPTQAARLLQILRRRVEAKGNIRPNAGFVRCTDSHNGSTQMNISQNKLKCFIYLFPKRTSIFSTVNKYRFRCAFEHTTLRCNMKSSVACQNSKRIGWKIFSITLN